MKLTNAQKFWIILLIITTIVSTIYIPYVVIPIYGVLLFIWTIVFIMEIPTLHKPLLKISLYYPPYLFYKYVIIPFNNYLNNL